MWVSAGWMSSPQLLLDYGAFRLRESEAITRSVFCTPPSFFFGEALGLFLRMKNRNAQMNSRINVAVASMCLAISGND